MSKETGDEAIGSDELILVCEEEELGESQEEVRLLNANVCLSVCLYVCCIRRPSNNYVLLKWRSVCLSVCLPACLTLAEGRSDWFCILVCV